MKSTKINRTLAKKHRLENSDGDLPYVVPSRLRDNCSHITTPVHKKTVAMIVMGVYKLCSLSIYMCGFHMFFTHIDLPSVAGELTFTADNGLLQPKEDHDIKIHNAAFTSVFSFLVKLQPWFLRHGLKTVKA